MIHGGARRGTEGHGELLNTFLSAEDAEGRGGARRGAENTLNPFYPRRGARRTRMNFLTPFCPRRTRRAAEGRGEHLKPFLSAKGGTKDQDELLNTFLSAEGRGGARRTP